jgi:mannose-6-phosphate isomerase, class I
MDIKKIHGVIKDYSWGGRDYLPSLFSYVPTGAPQAEAWFGTHSAGEAMTEEGETLSSFIAKDPVSALGEGAVKEFGGKLPLLLKVLAIQKPLSIQCHPDKAMAKEGWAKESEYRKSHGIEEWNYKDDNEKAEVIFALTPITAMCGFRPFDAIVAHSKELFPKSYEKYLDRAESIDVFFRTLYSLPKADLKELLDEYLTSLENNDEEFTKGQFLTEKGIALSAAKEYPLDPGLVCPYILNVVHLRVGEGLYLEPRTLHAYVYGNGIELMSNSDNVLRGGLTPKKVDLEELLHVMKAEAGGGEKCPLTSDKFGRTEVITPSDAFELLSISSGMYEIRERNAGIVLVTEGVARFSYGGEHIELRRGESAFIPYSVSEYTLNLRGKMFFARIPEHK